MVTGSSTSDTTSSGASSITLNLPQGVTLNQFLFATIAIEGANAASATITVPAGWTEIRHDTCGTDLQMSIASRIAQVSDTPSTAFTWNFNGSFQGSGGITAIFGANDAAPIEADSFQCTTASSSVTAPSVTTTNNNALDLLAFGINGDNSLSTPSGYTTVYQHDIATSGPDIGNDSMGIAGAGTETGDQTATAGAAGDNIGYQLAIDPTPLTVTGNFVYTNDDAATNTVSGFSVGSDGTLTLLAGSPFLTGGSGGGTTYYATNRIVISGTLLFASNDVSEDISVFTIDPGTGNLAPVAGSPFAIAATGDISLAVTPNGQFLFASDSGTSEIFAFSVRLGGSIDGGVRFAFPEWRANPRWYGGHGEQSVFGGSAH